jgi:hypothetical protein
MLDFVVIKLYIISSVIVRLVQTTCLQWNDL